MAIVEETLSADFDELDDDEFLENIASSGGANLLGTSWFENRLLRWLEDKNVPMLDKLRKALSATGAVRRGRKPQSGDERALEQARKLRAEVEDAVRTFAKEWRGASLWEYKNAARTELVERFLPNRPHPIKNQCLKRICNRKAGLAARTFALVSAVTGLPLSYLRTHIIPARPPDFPN